MAATQLTHLPCKLAEYEYSLVIILLHSNWSIVYKVWEACQKDIVIGNTDRWGAKFSKNFLSELIILQVLDRTLNDPLRRS